MNSSDGIKESISLIICFKIREDSILKCSKLLDDLLKYCFTKTISETNNTTNIFHGSQKMQRKTGSAQQKMHRACFLPLADTQDVSISLRQYVLIKPLPFSKPAYIFAEIQPRCQCYL